MWRKFLCTAIALAGSLVALAAPAGATQEDVPPAGQVTIVSVLNNLCFTVDRVSTDGALVRQVPCTGADNQRFTFTQAAPVIGAYVVTSVHSGLCLGTEATGSLSERACRGPPQQRFGLTEQSSGFFTISAGSAGCLSVSPIILTPITTAPCTGSLTQLFWIVA